GLDNDPYLHVTHKGEPGFLGVALEAESLKDLEALAAAEHASIEPLDGPGGGSVVRLTDPNEFRVEVVAGCAPASHIELAQPIGSNDAHETPRLNAPKRLKRDHRM
ncbi:MAG TPA: hypothetical protein VGI47_03425, partial [Candidatus Binataceae bacterium]